MSKYSKPLTWEQLADLYNKERNRRNARSLPMDYLFQWAERQTKRFKVKKNGTIVKRLS